MHRPRDVSTEERALQGTHCPRDETSETFRSGTHRLGAHHHGFFVMDSRFLPSSQISGRMYNNVVSNKLLWCENGVAARHYAVICKQLLKRNWQKPFRVTGLQGIVSQEEYFLTTDKIKTLLSRMNTYDYKFLASSWRENEIYSFYLLLSDYLLVFKIHLQPRLKMNLPIGQFRFFHKFAEIFTAQGAQLVSLTPVANGKNLQS
jgi:hypothetical protein